MTPLTVPAIMLRAVPSPASPPTTMSPRRTDAPASRPTLRRTKISPPVIPREAPGSAPPTRLAALPHTNTAPPAIASPASSPTLPWTAIVPPVIPRPSSRPALPSMLSVPAVIAAPMASTLARLPCTRTTADRSPRTENRSPSSTECWSCARAARSASHPVASANAGGDVWRANQTGRWAISVAESVASRSGTMASATTRPSIVSLSVSVTESLMAFLLTARRPAPVPASDHHRESSADGNDGGRVCRRSCPP